MKAQFWSFDIIFAMVIFVFAMVILTYVWINITGEFSVSYSGDISQMQGQLNTLDTQLLTQGNPTNWNNVVNLSSPGGWQNVSIGLGNGTADSLSIAKINKLVSMAGTNYQAVKPALGVSYEYYITFTGQALNISIGENPATTNTVSVQVISQPVVISGTSAIMQLQVWTNSTLGIE